MSFVWAVMMVLALCMTGAIIIVDCCTGGPWFYHVAMALLASLGVVYAWIALDYM